ncbi:MAG TPA: TonB-dependent receptor [Paucimonas sp.]|nr:TonB-dependent receptor [Paucimonas sp.]
MKTSNKKDSGSTLNRLAFKVSPIAAGCAVFLSMTAGGAQAQQAPTAQGNAASSSTVVVTGIRKGIEDAISVKKNSTSIVEAISAEDIGKLPDTSIAESISRLPGLAAQRVAGRSQTISIRGMSGDFAGTLLNGREQVSTGDNRGVEFDQYPSELLSSVVIYKTPDASLVGQGLSGTVDMQTVRPLAFGKRTIAVNVRGEKNSMGKLNADSRDTGSRFSVSYIDQFADRTFGVALGYARLDSPSQANRWEAWGYTAADSSGQTGVLGGFKAYVDSTKQVRDGLIGVLEWRPNKEFRSVLDMYYSKFDKEQKTRGFEVGLPWGGATMSNAVVENGMVVSANWTGIKPVLRNDLNKRTDDLSAIGWNNEWKNGAWTFVGDLSYSHAKRNESILETYAGTVGTRDNTTFKWDRDTGLPTLGAGLNYADPNIIRLNDSGGWGQDGYIKYLNVKDDLKALRLSAARDMDGWFSKLNFGLHYGEREKTKEVPEYFADLKGSTRGSSGFTSAPTPANGLLIAPTSLSFVGMPGVLSYDIETAFNTLYKLTPNVHKDIWNKNWTVKEEVTTAYARADIDTELGSVPVRGNVGLQFVRTDQSSTAFALPNGNANNPKPTKDGMSYNDTLPSLNLAFGLANDQTVRLGIAKVMARARVDQMRASKSYSYDQNQPAGRQWSGDGGNPHLKPFRANAFDISYEKYFGTKAYVGAAYFYKDLKSYIYTQDVPYDFAGLVNPLTGVVNPAGTIGKFSTPSNGEGGVVKGFELTASLPFSQFSQMLDGFGLIASYADTQSSIQPQGPGSTISLPGLSREVTNLTLYYEKHGFSGRVARRSRSAFVGEISGFGADRELVYIKPEKVIDVQFGYEFNSGMAKGLSLLLQVNNLTNAEYARSVDPAGTQGKINLPKEYVKYGRTILFGVNYKM